MPEEPSREGHASEFVSEADSIGAAVVVSNQLLHEEAQMVGAASSMEGSFVGSGSKETITAAVDVTGLTMAARETPNTELS